MTAKLFRSETLCECAMDRLVQTACDLFGAPIGLASIYDDKGALHRTTQGLDEAEISGEFNIANAVMEAGAGGVMVIEDAMADPRLQSHPLVIGAQALRSYAGATISDRNRKPVGAIGVLDRKARGPLTEAETRTLKRLAMMAGDLLHLEDAERESTGKRQTLELAETMAGVGHFRVDAATRQVFWSSEVFRIHGFEPGSVDPTVESARAPYFPEDAALVRGLIDAAMQTGDGYDARLRLTRADGEERVTRTKAHCEVDSRGHVTALIGVFQDITETILAQSALIDARKLAESHSQAKSDFLANMSHEIRTPLTSVIGFSSFLALSPTLTTKERHYVDRISVGSKALLGVINDVLDYSRLEAGAFDVDRTAFDPRAMVETAIALVEAQSNRNSLSLHVEISPAVPDAFVGDEAHLRQVAVNFLSNAVKFTPSGSITVILSMAGKRLRFAVADTGIGIAPEAIDRLFDRFTQANTSTTRLYGGSGLGLAISRRLIALMDGEIGADSEVGKGSTFWFEVPLPSVVEKSAPSFPEARSKAPVRVLVADDSPAIRRLVSSMLADAGIAADEVSNGAEAVSLARATHYDAILMDVHMPVLDGVEACQTIHAMQHGQAKTPVVALTAAVSNEQVRNYLSAGMVGHVGKPIRPAELLHELGLALGWHERTLSQA